MQNRTLHFGLSGSLLIFAASTLLAQDWPQWRGPNRDAKATGFKTPQTWPKQLTKKWSEQVGDGVATPALVGDKLYVFSRQDGNEVIRCMNAATGKELWKEKYEAKAATGPASGFPGPRSSPTVAEGKIVTLGGHGTLTCLDAQSGKILWQNQDHKGSVPRFFTSSSPIVVDGLCVAQFGGETKGGVVAYELSSGTEKWKWTEDGAAYASPSVITVNGAKAIIAETAKKIVALNLTGKQLWETPFVVTGRGYNSASPLVEGETIIIAGSNRGTKAVKIESKADTLTEKELWTNKDNSVIYNTPILKNDLLFGLSDKDNLFCIDTKTGKTAWSTQVAGSRGYGSIVDAGSVLVSLTPKAELIVFEPTDKEFKEIAKYKVSEAGSTYAYPILSSNRIFIKDKDFVTLWTVE